MGIVSCLGNSLDEVCQALREGRSGIELIPERKELGFRGCLSGTLKNFQMPKVSKQALRQMGEGGYLGAVAAQQAVADSKLDEAAWKTDRSGVIIGNDGNIKDVYEQCKTVAIDKKKLGGTALQRVMNSSVSANLAVLFGIRGQAMTVSAACASGAVAIGHAYQQIKLDLQDRMLCGGVQEITWHSGCQFDALRAYSVREDAPAQASRPFDKFRDGLVPSGGSGVVVLEEYEQALARGAKIYGEIIGYAINSDGQDMTMPSGEGSVRCMQKALGDAEITHKDVEYINAHATSTEVGDVAEAGSIAKVFGMGPLVSSTKSMTGHEICTAGSSELVYTLLMMNHGFVAPSINIEEVDERCSGINIVANRALERSIRIAMSNSFAFGGVNTCLVLRKSDFLRNGGQPANSP
jgi:3-oxoacyl-[acyl-carrier-protein] synthase-1